MIKLRIELILISFAYLKLQEHADCEAVGSKFNVLQERGANYNLPYK